MEGPAIAGLFFRSFPPAIRDHDVVAAVLVDVADSQAVVSGMVGVLADLRADLLDMGEAEPELSVSLLEQHARLLSFIRVHAFGQDASEALG